MFVWVFHRISGLLLILLIALQLTTGLVQARATSPEAVRVTAEFHRHAALNCLFVFLFVFHALYGLRTLLLDLGVRREKLLFWGCTLSGAVLYGAFLVAFFTLVRP